MHVGILGHGSIVMLDDIHLSLAMGVLIRSINRIQNHSQFRTMTLSATSIDTQCAFKLLPGEETDPTVQDRLHAIKTSDLHPVEKLADQIVHICELAAAHRTGTIAVFVRTVGDAGKIAGRLGQSLGEGGSERVALLTGTLHGRERAELAAGTIWQRFLPN